jgi:hypothetical protein
MRILTVLMFSFVLLSQSAPAERQCGPSGKSYVRTTLYFGLSRAAGAIGDDEWQTFLRDEVTPRFPEGLTVWEADGQWRRSDESIARERAKVMLLVHDGKAKALKSINELINKYKQKFDQQSVLWESAAVCAAF